MGEAGESVRGRHDFGGSMAGDWVARGVVWMGGLKCLVGWWQNLRRADLCRHRFKEELGFSSTLTWGSYQLIQFQALWVEGKRTTLNIYQQD